MMIGRPYTAATELPPVRVPSGEPLRISGLSIDDEVIDGALGAVIARIEDLAPALFRVLEQRLATAA